VAIRIDRIEREFILGRAAETKTRARLRTAGKSMDCVVAGLSREGVGFMMTDAFLTFAPQELVSVCFDFRGQAIAFEAPVRNAASGTVVLDMPETMYRSLSRKWPRVSAPKDLSVEFLLADADLILDCPESESWSDVELPELREGLDSHDLKALVESFRIKAVEIASEGRVIMYKERGPSNIAEDMAAKLGRTLYVPSTSGPLPQGDPYPTGRIITRDMADEFEGPAAAAQGTRLSAYLRARAAEGMISGLWCPVIYYRYAVGIILIANGPDRPQALGFGAVDLAWEFSRILAWFLKRYGYFSLSGPGTDEDSSPFKGGVIDASPSGILVALPDSGPAIARDSVIRLKLSVKDKIIVCPGKVVRKFQEGDMNYYGIAFMDLPAKNMAALSFALYGEDEAFSMGGA
jgi:hypothetical protein